LKNILECIFSKWLCRSRIDSRNWKLHERLQWSIRSRINL